MNAIRASLYINCQHSNVEGAEEKHQVTVSIARALCRVLVIQEEDVDNLEINHVLFYADCASCKRKEKETRNLKDFCFAQ